MWSLRASIKHIRPYHTSCIAHSPTTSAHTSTLSPSTSIAHNNSSATPIDSVELMNDDKKYILGTYARFPHLFVRGDGCYLYDSNNVEYLDFYAGIAVNALGHSHSDVSNTVIKHTNKLTHISNLYYSVPQIKLAKLLLESCRSDTCNCAAANTTTTASTSIPSHISSGGCFQKLFYSNSGTEANEGAIKFARKYAYTQTKSSIDRPNKKIQLIAFNGGFHGRTVGSLSVTYKQQYKQQFMPLMDNVTFVDYNDINAFKKMMNDNVCAVIVEPIQGEGGVNPGTKQFIQSIRDECNKYNAVMIVDEVQCGVGRTGSLWAHSTYGVQPDIMTLAKPLANGLPIGAILMKQHIADCITPGDHGSTFSGGPLITSVAHTVVSKIQSDEFLQHVQSMGKLLYNELVQLKNKLSQHNTDNVQIIDIRSHEHSSLLVGVDLNVPVKDIIIEASGKHQLLLISGGDKTIRLCPPLIINEEQIRYAVNALEKLLIDRPSKIQVTC